MSEKKIPNSQRSFILQFGEKNFGAGLKNFPGVGFGLKSISKIFPLLQKKAEFNYEPFKLSDILLFYPTPCSSSHEGHP